MIELDQILLKKSLYCLLLIYLFHNYFKLFCPGETSIIKVIGFGILRCILGTCFSIMAASGNVIVLKFFLIRGDTSSVQGLVIASTQDVGEPQLNLFFLTETYCHVFHVFYVFEVQFNI